MRWPYLILNNYRVRFSPIYKVIAWDDVILDKASFHVHVGCFSMRMFRGSSHLSPCVSKLLIDWFNFVWFLRSQVCISVLVLLGHIQVWVRDYCLRNPNEPCLLADFSSFAKNSGKCVESRRRLERLILLFGVTRSCGFFVVSALFLTNCLNVAASSSCMFHKIRMKFSLGQFSSSDSSDWVIMSDSSSSLKLIILFHEQQSFYISVDRSKKNIIECFVLEII